MSITGQPDGPPTKAGVAVVDVIAGLFATIGILAALRARRADGPRATGRNQLALESPQRSGQPDMRSRRSRRCSNAHGQCASEHRAV